MLNCRYLNSVEDGWVSRHGKVIKALEMLLVGTCVELTFGTSPSSCQCAEVGQEREMNHRVATGVRLLGTNSNETVLSILSTQVMPPQKPAAAQLCRDPVSMTQQNSTDPNSSSFLYESDSQIINTLDPKNVPDQLRLESFVLESQSGHEHASDASHVLCSVDDEKDDDLQKSEEIVRELESEWQRTQTTQKQQLPHEDADLALSEEVLSELQESFDHSIDSSPPLTGRDSTPPLTGRDSSPPLAGRDSSPPLAGRDSSPPPNGSCSESLSSVTSATITPLSNLSSWRLPKFGGCCCGTPELFSSRKKLAPQGRAGELLPSLSFTPELFGPTPLVCCRHGYPSTSRISSTPLSLSGKTNAPQEEGLVDNRTTTAPQPHGDLETSQELLFCGRTCSPQEYQNYYTPRSLRKRSFTFECTISSPDLFL